MRAHSAIAGAYMPMPAFIRAAKQPISTANTASLIPWKPLASPPMLGKKPSCLLRRMKATITNAKPITMRTLLRSSFVTTKAPRKPPIIEQIKDATSVLVSIPISDIHTVP